MNSKYEYDVVLSFAREQRAYVERVARILKKEGVRVFYDTEETAELWGKDLSIHLHDIFSRSARYCVIFISETYVQRMWTAHELRSALARSLVERGDYILPVRLDGTAVPGLRNTLGFIDATQGLPAADLARLIVYKVLSAMRDGDSHPSRDQT